MAANTLAAYERDLRAYAAFLRRRAGREAVDVGGLTEADLVIGAVLVAGGRAPIVITEDMVATMKPGCDR